MFNAPRLTISGCVTALLAACGFMLTLEAQQAPASAPASAAPHRTVVSQYCLSCHNERLKRGGLALDAAVAKDVEQHPDEWEKVVRKLRARQMPPVGLPRPDEATYDAVVASLEAALDRAAARRAQPGPHRHVPAAQPHRIPERHSRSAGARRRRRRRCCRRTRPATASTTSRSAISRRRCSTATSRRRRRSAGWRSAARAVARTATRSASGRTSRRRSTSTGCRSARAAAR